MKSKDIAMCGVMIALFVAISYSFSFDVRAFQSYMEILKITIIAVAIRLFVPINKQLLFTITCFCVCILVLPLHQNVIYNVPSLISGLIIGKEISSKKFLNFTIYFCINTIMTIYEFILCYVLLGTNLFISYSEGIADILTIFFKIQLSDSMLNTFFVLTILSDSLFSSAVIFIFSDFIIERIKILKE